MTRAEEAARKAYPNEMVTTCARGNKFRAGPLLRRGFQEGYELAEKETIEYACYELELRLPEYLNYNGIQVERAEFIKDFRKAMEEEQ